MTAFRDLNQSIPKITSIPDEFMTTRLAWNSNPLMMRCGRTAWNNALTEALVFHQTLSTPKASYSGRVPSGTPQGRARIIHIFPQGSNNENELQYLVHFIHLEFFKIFYYNTKFRVQNIKQWNNNKHLSVMNKDPSVPTRRILHTTAMSQEVPATGVNKPWVHNVLARLIQLVGIISRL